MKISISLNYKLVVVGMLFSINIALAQKEAEKIKTYLQANAAKHHLSGNDIQEMTVSSAYLSPTTGWYHVYYNQVYQSVEVYNGVLNATLINDKVEHVGNSFVENIAAKIPSGIIGSQLSPLTAINKVAAHLGLNHNPLGTKEEAVTRLANGQVTKAVYTNTTLSNDSIPVRLYWFSHTTTENKPATTNMHLVWSVGLFGKNHKNYWIAQVDAHSGEVLNVDDQVVKCSFENPDQVPHQHSHLQNTSPDVAATKSPRLTPLAANSYHVVDFPLQSPNHGARTIVTNPYTKFAPLGTGPGPTNGWHHDGFIAYYNTRGNNVYAQDDIVGDDSWTIGSSPTSPTLEFDYPYTQGINTAEGNQNAAITNLFYWNNLIHDILWKYGFDEPSGNFQLNNMGRGGEGNDYVLADAQDGFTLNNATFYAPPDGGRPQMNMGLQANVSGYQPDSDFDNTIITHEYGHGWSVRLTGGPAINTCLTHAEQAGEGWSDYLGLMLTTQWSSLTPSVASANIPRDIGTYFIGQPTNGTGLRGFHYSYDMASVNNTVTYGKVATYNIPHGIGSIWATTLWDMTWEIIFQDNQIVNDIYNTTNIVGNVAALKLVNEGLRLQKCSPNFIDSRNAILKADSLLFNSRYSCAIWKAFARRGMGANASSGASSNDRIVIEDFTPVLNNGWTFSSPTKVVTCSNSVFNYTATVSGATPTFKWARAAVAGISNTAASGNTATISETLVNTTNNPITATYKFSLSPSSCQVPVDISVVVNPSPMASVAKYEICKDGTIPVGEGLVATNPFYTNSVVGSIVAGPTYWRAKGDNVTTYSAAPNGLGSSVYYQTHTFTPTTSGVVSIEAVDVALLVGFPHDTYLSLYQTSFNPASPAVNFVAGDDDSGTLQYASKITYNFTAGTTYIIVVSTYYNGTTGTYRLQATTDIFGGPNNWYADASGGSALVTGNLFNPVGVAGSAITNTATPITKNFYLGSMVNACRTPTAFAINSPSTGGYIAGTISICSNINRGQMTLILYEKSVVRWESSTDGFNTINQIPDTSATITYTNLPETTQFRALVRNGACNAVYSSVGTVSIDNAPLPAVTNFKVCEGTFIVNGSGLESPVKVYSNTVTGTLTTTSPTYTRAMGDNATTYVASTEPGGDAVGYKTYLFVAPVSGQVSIETVGGTLTGGNPYDTYLSLYEEIFYPTAPYAYFLAGDDDSGTLPFASKLTYNLTAGKVYILVVAGWQSGMTGSYEVRATADIFDANTIKWYANSTGGPVLATGNIFNPLGVADSGIPDLNTPLTKAFFIEAPGYPSCLIPAVFTIDPATIGGNMAGTATYCDDTNTGTITLSGHAGNILHWESSTNNFTTVNTIANTTTTLNYTNITQTTQYRASLKNGICRNEYSHKAVIIRPTSPAITTDYNICKDAAIPVGQGLVNTSPGYTDTINGALVAGSPSYAHGIGNEQRTYIAAPWYFGVGSAHYKTYTFTPTTTGQVTIEMIAATLDGDSRPDFYMSLYENSFDPGWPATNFRSGDDDSGTLDGTPKIVDVLTAGTTYILVVCTYEDGKTGAFEIQATADIFGNPVNWYDVPSGGATLATGNIFNPVGVSGSGILNTATPIVKTFYTGYPSFGSCFAPATFTINTLDPPTLTGSTRCSPGTSILTATGCTGGTVNWYAGISGGTAIATGTSFTTPSISTNVTYYANCTRGTCITEKIPVVAAIGTTDATYSTPQTPGNYQVSQTISSSANVATGVNYFAGKAIILVPGFQAGGSEVFSASIKDCL